MRGAKPLPPSPDLQYAAVLYGWVEIAKYLRRSAATVRRWHEERRMPIAYLGMTVVIPCSALDLWIMAGRSTQRNPAKTEALAA
jgi:excisionase family DNA binding protein